MPQYEPYVQGQVIGGPTVLVNPNSAANRTYFGRTAIGSSQVAVGASYVNSDSIITYGVRIGVNSYAGNMPDIFTTSVVAGTGFYFATTASYGQVGSLGMTAEWIIFNQHE